MALALATAVIAVLGTLLGSVVTGRFQERAADRTERETRRRNERSEQLAAITGLAEAVRDRKSVV